MSNQVKQINRALDVVETRPNFLLYCAGPMRTGDQNENIYRGLISSMELLREGWVVIVPQLSEFFATVAGHPLPGGPYDLGPDGARGWLDYDFRLLSRCDAVVRFPGESAGADAEVELALKLGLPVFTYAEAMKEAANGFPTMLEWMASPNIPSTGFTRNVSP